jgi:hypothetical protein
MEHYSNVVATYFEAIRTHHRNSIQHGLMAGDPTTGSTQASGVGNTDWNVDASLGMATVDGDQVELPVAADLDMHSGSLLLADGESVHAFIVLKNVSGTVSAAPVVGTPATTGSQVDPTDAEIQAAVGAGNEWILMARCVLNRTGDTTVTQSQDNTVRPVLGVNVDPNVGDF